MTTKTTPIFTKSERKGVFQVGKMFYTNDIPVFWKKVDRSRHYMRVVKGYGVQEDVYKGYIEKRRGWVLIEESEKSYLLSEMMMWDKRGKTMEFQGVDGSQRFLSERYMEKFTTIDEMKAHVDANPPALVSEQQELLRFS